MTAEELLADGEVYEYSNVLVIDAETREINIPLGEEFFGVEGDKDVERKYFSCPKIVGDNIDLSECNIYSNYVLADKEGNPKSENVESYFCDDMVVDGDNIKFTWKLSERVLKEDGFIAFAIVAKKSIDGVLKNRWYTTPGVGIVKKTIKDGEELQQQFPDVIDNLINRVHDIEMSIESGGTGGGGATKEQIEQIETNKKDIARLSEEIADQENRIKTLEDNPSGATAEQIAQIETNKNDIANLKIVKVEQSDLETEVADQIDGVKADIVQEVLAQLGGDASSIFGRVNEDGTITMTTDLAEGEYTLMYENEDGTLTEIGTVTIGEVAMFSIARNLSGCTSNKSTTVIKGGSAWTETISVNSGHTMSSITVTMGGVDVTNSVYSGGVINIAEVTGNIVITATATLPNYNNLADTTSSDWSPNMRLSSSGSTKSSTGALTTNYIACKVKDVVRIKGLNIKTVLPDGTNYPMLVTYNSSKAQTGGFYPQSTHKDVFVEENGIVTYTLAVNNSGDQSGVEVAYIRICGKPIDGESVIVTINEEIS